jgi:uncharacterized protein DUF5818
MNRTTNLIAGLFLLISGVAFCQDQQSALQVPEDALSPRELIAWSSVQKPQPTPQPLPPPDTPVPQPDPQAGSSQKPSENQSQPQAPTAQSFVGKIVREGGTVVLKVAKNTTYQLEGAGDTTQYENRNVKIEGSLNASGNTIHVVRIELLS